MAQDLIGSDHLAGGRQSGGEGMTKRVGRDLHIEMGTLAQLLDQLFHVADGQTPVEAIDEQRSLGSHREAALAIEGQQPEDRRLSRCIERDQTRLTALGRHLAGEMEPAPRLTAIRHVGHVQSHQF